MLDIEFVLEYDGAGMEPDAGFYFVQTPGRVPEQERDVLASMASIHPVHIRLVDPISTPGQSIAVVCLGATCCHMAHRIELQSEGVLTVLKDRSWPDELQSSYAIPTGPGALAAPRDWPTFRVDWAADALAEMSEADRFMPVLEGHYQVPPSSMLSERAHPPAARSTSMSEFHSGLLQARQDLVREALPHARRLRPPAARTVVICLDHLRFEQWCREQDPPVNPRDSHLYYVSTSYPDGTRRIRGVRLRAGDRVTQYGSFQEGRYTIQVLEEVRMLEQNALPGYRA